MGSLAVAFNATTPSGTDVVRRMLAAAPHRGSDVSHASSGATTIGVARHSELGDASVIARDGLIAAVVGCIDNRAELDRALADEGLEASEASAASTVLNAFSAWGNSAPGRLRGSFAAVLFDGVRLRCFRDQLGTQTLFLGASSDGFLVASEAKQVVAGKGQPREPDLSAVADIFFGRLEARKTALRGVERVPHATVVTVEPGGEVKLARYWDPSSLLETASLSVSEAKEQLVQVFEQAAGRALSGRDAVTLSGGIDSPTVAAFAAPQHLALSGRPLTAISTVYPEYPRVDESQYIVLIAERLGLELHTYPHTASPLEDISHWVDALDGPWEILSIPEQAATCRQAQELGVRRLLTGELAEDVVTVGGPLFAHLVLTGRARAARAWLAHARRRRRDKRTIAREMLPGFVPAFAATTYFRMRRAHFRARKSAGLPAWVDGDQIPGTGFGTDFALPMRQRWTQRQASTALGSASPSFEADELCAARLGIERRLPFTDVDLWEFFLSLPAEVKFPDYNNASKSLLKQTMRGRLPDEILDRRHKTFFNDHILGTADYPRMKKWLSNPEWRLEGVDYGALAVSLSRQDMNVDDVVWAYDLARAHAFVALFE